MRQWQRGLRWGEWDVASNVVGAGSEPILLWDWNVVVNNDNRHKALALVEDLDLETGWDLGDAGVDDFSRLNVAAAEREANVGGWDEVWEDIGDDRKLVDTLLNEELLVLRPLLLGEVTVDWLGHVAWVLLAVRFS